MIQNRAIPYGYEMVNGAMTIHEEESSVVKIIFQMYTEGSSYLTIANCLTSQDIRYIPTKPAWNKNMVARILQNKVYLGTEKYPAIIAHAQFHMSQSAKKPYTHTEPKEIKALKPLLVCRECGEKLRRRLKKDGTHRWYCPTDIDHISATVSDDSILSDMASMQKILAHAILQVQANGTISIETVRLQNEIDRLLEQTELQVEEIRGNILKLASLKYSLCPDTHHAEQAMLEELQRSDKMVDTKLLTKLIEHIEVSHDVVSTVLLKCGNHIKRGEYDV